ncbi:MAG: HAMP domain-containing histidine kinase [Ktedonobacteraceae bacterium]|nr:HAMP domain-containing histidine kinase [Ktedonobacteraceae bacterium]MBO0793516.1 HAMP domain-containing histidine kinase [Ktedonobacteraceae bacterium]
MPEAKHIGAESERTAAADTEPFHHLRLGHIGESADMKQRPRRSRIFKKQGAGEDAPTWLRPFFSLRAQLLVTYTLLLILVVLIVCWLIYAQASPPYVILTAAIAVVIGALLAYACTTLLLRPLGQVIDVAQAIAVGDLQQRERLVLRLPPQDDIDRLAGSLDEMVNRLERAGAMQDASEQRFKRFFSDASHQLRTPLTSIRGFTEILMRGAIDDPETRQRVLTRMKNEAERMTLLVNDLLTLARLDDTHPLKLQYVDLLEVAIEAVKQARSRAGESCQISLDLATEPRLGVQADGERIKQLLFILLDNALKYGGSAPRTLITLRLAREGKRAVISVIDNGAGIDSADLEHIFDSFYRGRGRGSASGVGLGLTIASTIAFVHGGTISATSRPGRTEFTVNLPCI